MQQSQDGSLVFNLQPWEKSLMCGDESDAGKYVFTESLLAIYHLCVGGRAHLTLLRTDHHQVLNVSRQ